MLDFPGAVLVEGIRLKMAITRLPLLLRTILFPDSPDSLEPSVYFKKRCACYWFNQTKEY